MCRADAGTFDQQLRETTSEIHSYFGAGSGASGFGKGSQDSGIVDAAGGAGGGSGVGGSNGNGAGGELASMMGGLSLASSTTTLNPDAQEELINDIMTELSNHNTRVDERLKAMHQLRRITRDGTFTLWDDHFKPILMILLETLGDTDWRARMTALTTIRELCQCQAPRFRECAELTLLRVLEVERDGASEAVSKKDLNRAAEETCRSLATHLPPAICFRVLNPIIANEKPPGLNASLCMLRTVLEQLNREEAEAVLDDVVPGVIRAYDNADSSVRKAAVVCLVQLHDLIGAEGLAPYVACLATSKVSSSFLLPPPSSYLSPPSHEVTRAGL